MHSLPHADPMHLDVPAGGLTPLETLHSELQGVRRSVDQDQMVALEGAPRKHVIGVATGLLRCFRITPDGRRHITRFVGPGGLIGLGTHATYRNSAEAVSDSSLITFPSRALDAAMERSSKIRKAVMDGLTLEMSVRDQTHFRVGRLWADERVADFLLEVHSSASGAESGTNEIRMSRSDIADHLGVTIETVSRALNRFQKMNLIKFVDVRHFVVLRLNDLSNFALGDWNGAAHSTTSWIGTGRKEGQRAA